jgi:arylformamidase
VRLKRNNYYLPKFDLVRVIVMNKNKKDDSDIIAISKTSFHDVTHMIYEDMPVYPGEIKPEFSPLSILGKDKVNVTRLTLGSHTGTHIDAPIHFIPNAESIDKISLGKLIGEAVILDMSKKSVGQGITNIDLDTYKEMVEVDDIILLYSGTSKRWDKDEEIRKNFTYLDPSGAKWIVDHNIKCVGIDSFSVEKYGFTEGLAHKTLLSNGIGIIEGLNSSLEKFVGNRMFLVCLPLMLKGIDGSPARAILLDIAT